MTVSTPGSVNSEGILKFSTSFGYMGREYMSNRKDAFFGLDAGRHTGGDDMDDLREEEVWGEESFLGRKGEAFVQRAVNEGQGAGESYRRSKLSVEMHSATFVKAGRSGMSTKASNPKGLMSSTRTKIPQAGKGEGYGKQNAGTAADVPQSAPVRATYWTHNAAQKEDEDEAIEDYGEDDDDEVKLPPHEFLARQYAKSKVMACSVFEGAGRTLKGMDLRRVRNSVWRQTGFLD